MDRHPQGDEGFTSFTDDQYRLILAYLQNHSKDLGGGRGGTGNDWHRQHACCWKPTTLLRLSGWRNSSLVAPMRNDSGHAFDAGAGRTALDRDTLDQQLAAEAICLELAGGPCRTDVRRAQRRHAALFGGIFRQQGAPPYASVWDGTGRLFGPAVERMQALRELDVHLAPDCKEPADHVAIELPGAGRGAAARPDAPVEALVMEMRGWGARFCGCTDFGRWLRFLR